VLLGHDVPGEQDEAVVVVVVEGVDEAAAATIFGRGVVAGASDAPLGTSSVSLVCSGMCIGSKKLIFWMSNLFTYPLFIFGIVRN
jgi:hypothetical protein